MRYNHSGYQNQARERAENLGQMDGERDAKARELRRENVRRAKAALAAPAVHGPDRDWLMRDVCSTPYAEVRA